MWLALSERVVLRYEQRSGETLSANMKVGLVLRQLGESALKQHLQ